MAETALPLYSCRVARARHALTEFARWFSPKKREVNQRREPRLPAHGLVTMMWRDSADRPQQETVQLIDISVNGLALRVPRPFAAGETIFATDGRKICQGTVRRCSADADTFVVGVERVRTEKLPASYAGQFPESDFELFAAG